jgi:large subunit ribosomal protein L44e
MKYPKMLRIYCKYCKKHTLQDVEFSKKRPRGSMSIGQRIFKRKMRGYGSFPKENPGKREKPTRRVDLRFKCKTCGKYNLHGRGFRVKKLEFVKK